MISYKICMATTENKNKFPTKAYKTLYGFKIKQ